MPKIPTPATAEGTPNDSSGLAFEPSPILDDLSITDAMLAAQALHRDLNRIDYAIVADPEHRDTPTWERQMEFIHVRFEALEGLIATTQAQSALEAMTQIMVAQRSVKMIGGRSERDEVLRLELILESVLRALQTSTGARREDWCTIGDDWDLSSDQRGHLRPSR